MLPANTIPEIEFKPPKKEVSIHHIVDEFNPTDDFMTNNPIDFNPSGGMGEGFKEAANLQKNLGGAIAPDHENDPELWAAI